MIRRLDGAIRRLPLVGRIAGAGATQDLRRTLRAARAVSAPVRFVALQVVSHRSGAYRLRHSGLTVFLRHGTRDVDVFREIFGAGYEQNSYDPPPSVAARLDGAAAPAVLDLGGNIGLFGVYVLARWPRATLVSYEPDPTNLPILERVIAVNGLRQTWSAKGAAVANQDGELPFVSGLFAESQLAGVGESSDGEPDAASLREGHTISVPVVDLFTQGHDVDLVKMDIEGGEWSILTDPRLAELKAPAIVLEWHEAGCPDADAHAATIRLLSAAGYTGRSETENLGSRGVLWAWREGDAGP